jgi:uncharacterized membrane protein YhaH (DUF805 family)
MFVLFNVIFSAVLNIIDYAIGINVFGAIYSLAVLIPSLAVSVRRLHDTNRTGWWVLIGLIPLVGTIILIVFLATDSQPGENQYGPNPKTGTV